MIHSVYFFFSYFFLKNRIDFIVCKLLKQSIEIKVQSILTKYVADIIAVFSRRVQEQGKRRTKTFHS